MKLAKFPIILLTISIIIGIVIQHYIAVNITILLLATIVMMLLASFMHWQYHQKDFYKKSFTIIIVFTSILVGATISHYNNQQTFVQQQLKTERINKRLVVLQINKVLKSSEYYHHYIAIVEQIDSIAGKEKILLKQPAKETRLSLQNRLILLCDKENIKRIEPPKNPFGFDYAKYMQTRHVTYQINLSNIAYKTETNHKKTLNYIAQSWRQAIYKLFVSAKLPKENLAFASAIFLGDRQYLNKETQYNFQSSGTVHILAISGLHIGILLLFLNFIFGFIKKLLGTIPFTIIVILSLWLYAFMTGFSPSVTRAVTMFSFVQIGLHLKRKTYIINTVFASALLMILYNPNIIYNIGFQMSYAAVLSIVNFFPLLSKRIHVNNRFANWFVELFLVSVTAQLGVLPLSLYYFHQFPVYFFVSNLLIIPLLFLVLFTGFVFILLGIIGINIDIITSLFNWLLGLILKITEQIATLESALIKDIPFKFTYLIIFYFIIITFYHVLHKKKKVVYIFSLMLLILGLQLVVFQSKYSKSKEQNYYIFQQYKDAIVGKSHGDSLTLYNKKINPYLLRDLKKAYSIIYFDSLYFVQYAREKTILHIDSLGIYRYKNIYPDIIHLSYSPKLNLDRVIEKLKPKMIVADGSNYPSYIKRWKKSAFQKNILFFDTNKKGAFILK